MRGGLLLVAAALCSNASCYRSHEIAGSPERDAATDAMVDASATDAGRPVDNPAVRIATGNQTTCAVRAEGDVWCWGDGEDGQLGRGVDDRSTRPVRIALPVAADVFVGGSHVCANEPRSGLLHCWGSNGFGQIDEALGRHVLEPAIVGYGGRVFAAGLGTRHTCAGVVHDGGYAVRCRGAPLEGQFAGASLAPDGTAELPLPRAFLIRSEDKSTCASTLEGVFCWGGIRGDGAPRVARDRLVRVSTEMAESLGVGRADLFGGGRECGVLGGLRCWDRDPGARAEPVEDAPPIRGIAMRHHVLCGIVGGRAHCAGRNFAGQLGDGTLGDGGEVRRALRPVRLDREVVLLDTGDAHVCAIDAIGEVWCWGANGHGQLGTPGDDAPIPRRVVFPDAP